MSIHIIDWQATPPAACRGGAVTIGNFDGVHRGHAALVAEAARQAKTFGGPAVALTFDPHPLLLLRPKQFQPLLTTAADRAELLAARGADQVVILRVTHEMLHLSAAQFFHEVIRERLAARVLVEGPNFGFGRNREGNVEVLAAHCGQNEIRLVVVPPVLHDGRPISTSRVKNSLLGGAVREAAELLNRPYRLYGTVVAGQKRGRTLGFATANLDELETLVPGNGVYAVQVHHGGAIWPGAANIGPNPTFDEHQRKVEVHLIGFQGDLLGQKLAVDFLERLRDTVRFAGVQQLLEQLQRDVEAARRIAGAPR
jgi:riboflavin kinase/FMN adenylyltransferase